MRLSNLSSLAGDRCVLFLACAVTTISAVAQSTAPNEWTWVSGSNIGVTTNSPMPGVYGTLGTPAPANNPGGRWQATTWTDNSGNLWLFGGWANDTAGNFTWFNDLWKYSPSANEWTWMNGSNTVTEHCTQAGVAGTLGTPAPGNTPGPRYGSASWIDPAGHLWLFGGYTCGMQNPDDLWEYDPASNEWAWMGGDLAGTQPGVYGTLGTPAQGNTPGGRNNAVTWLDGNGHFWLFGGYGWDATKSYGVLNDLWEFDPSTNEWTWKSGSSTLPVAQGYTALGVYGTRGVPDPANTPGSRAAAGGWIDTSGHLWLFGGYVNNPNGTQDLLNDMWEFDPSTNEWTWMNGSSTPGSNCSQSAMPGLVWCGQPGVYGIIGTPAASNTPGGKVPASSWTEKNGRLWLFGGDTFDQYGVYTATFGDLWAFDPTTNQWTWMGGNSSVNCPNGGLCSETGVYGTLGQPAPANYPGSRNSTMAWTDANGNFWAFGGSGFDSTADVNYLDDLWVLQPSDTVNLPKPDFSVTAYPTSMTVTGGQSGTFSVYVTPSGGFNSATSFSCSGLPAGASCSFSPATVTPSSVAAKTSVTITTSIPSASVQGQGHAAVPFAVLAAVLFCFGRKARRRFQMLVLLVTCLLGLGLFTGCSGGGGSSSSTPISTTSTVTVTASAGTIQHTATLSLTVN